jgi:hypothetical protein
VVPWLLEADVQLGNNVKLLLLDAKADAYSAKVVPVSGLQFEDNNITYRYALAELNASDEGYGRLAQLVAALVSANDRELAAALEESHIAYVLVPVGQSENTAELVAALDSVTELTSAGNTEFGRLWRVTVSVPPAIAEDKSPWSVTKLVQLAVLAGFILLAIPTNSSRARRSKAAEIFIDTDGEQA